MIVDLLNAAKGEEVHITDIAYFLQLDPVHADRWMWKHGAGLWMTGRDRSWWRRRGPESHSR